MDKIDDHYQNKFQNHRNSQLLSDIKNKGEINRTKSNMQNIL